MVSRSSSLLRSDVQEFDGRVPIPFLVEGMRDQEPNRLRVLAVDDSRFQRQVMARLLSRLGAEVTWAEDGEEGLQLGRSAWSGGQPFDAILMDMQMPKKDGYETVKELRDSGVETPIVAITSHSRERFDELGVSASCNAYLQKPVSPENLQHAFEVAVEESIALAESESEAWDDEKFRSLVRRYIASLGELRSAVVLAREHGDVALIQKLSHQTRGNSASCHLDELSQAAGVVEDALAKGGELGDEEFRGFVQALDRTFARTV